jgi:hypothetical protein
MKGALMSRNISWIREIFNNTTDSYTVWCWDTDNEGKYLDFNNPNTVIGVNDNGNPITFTPGQHVITSGGSCGIPDGGDKNGRPKQRVFFLGTPDAGFQPSVGPGRGLRLNRTSVDSNTDQIIYTDEATGDPLGRMTFAQGSEQTINVIINSVENGGLALDVVESSVSTEAKWDSFVAATGQWIATKGVDLAVSALKSAAAAAVAA